MWLRRLTSAPQMTEPIEALLFDFGGTLDADGVAWKERFYAHYLAEGLDMTPEAFEAVFFSADDPLVGGLPIDTDLSGTVHELTTSLEAELAHTGAGIADCDRARRVASYFLADASAAFARNRPVLEALRRRYRLGIVSNFYGNLEAVCHGTGLAPLFSAIVDSHRIGSKKPDPAIFRAALEPLHASPEATLLVGDSLRRDREGARRIGMGFVWVAPSEAQVSGAQPDHPVVARLGDLAKILL
jgi:HAD superfamily hydrolase (TIGR01549 family)